MIRLILLTITLMSFANVSYASFPVTEMEQTEVIEYDSINNLPVIFTGVLVGILSWIIFPLNLLLLIFIKDRFFRTSFIIGMIIGIILIVLMILSAMTLGAAFGG